MWIDDLEQLKKKKAEMSAELANYQRSDPK